MTPNELNIALGQHRPSGLFYKPLKQAGLRRLRVLEHPLIHQWLGEAPDGSQMLVRAGTHHEALELLLNEAERCAAVEHQHVISMAWTVRPKAHHLTLGFHWPKPLTLKWPLDLRWLIRCFISAARGAGALHRAGLVHCDLKPESICFTEDPQHVRIWGLHMAQPPGTPEVEAWSARFAAPEQITGAPLDATADVYALGVSLYSMFIRSRFPTIQLSGQPRGVSPAPPSPQTMMGIDTGPVGPPPGGAFLSAATHVGVIPDHAGVPAAAQGPAQEATHSILGAKLMFARQMEQVAERTADIGAAHGLLTLIDKACAQKPTDRFADGDALASALEGLL
ncbi:MAG: protein kinase domain-containing protein [Bradymonadia bacterium]